MTLNVYMGYDARVGSNEGAVLIFANTAKEARRVGWGTMSMHFDTTWLDMSVRRLKKNLEYLKEDAIQEKLAAGIPHCVDDMRFCPSCELWGEDGGAPDENGCGYCRAE